MLECKQYVQNELTNFGVIQNLVHKFIYYNVFYVYIGIQFFENNYLPIHLYKKTFLN